MKKTLTYFAILLSTLFLPVASVSAHTLKVDGNIGITLHINPNDEPIANQVSQLVVGIKDRSGALSETLVGCICEARIWSKTGESYTQIALPENASGTTAVSYTFEEAGTYKIDIQGTPKEGYTFQEFKAQFIYNVKQGDSEGVLASNNSANLNPLRTYIPLVIFLSFLLLMIIYLTTTDLKKLKTKPPRTKS